MKDIVIARLVDDNKQTTGHMFLSDGERTYAHFMSLELPWKNNEVRVSCIPVGTYICRVRYSEKYGRHLEVEVPGRTLILLHYGNFFKDTKGCILVGKGFSKIDGDDRFDVTQSKVSMNKLMSFIQDDERIRLTIKEAIVWR